MSPIFVMLLVSGVVDVGRMIVTASSLADAAQEGANYAAFHAADRDGITARAAAVADADLGSGASTVVVDCPAGPGGDSIRVTVAAMVEPVTPFIADVLGGARQVVRSATAPAFGPEGCDL